MQAHRRRPTTLLLRAPSGPHSVSQTLQAEGKPSYVTMAENGKDKWCRWCGRDWSYTWMKLTAEEKVRTWHMGLCRVIHVGHVESHSHKRASLSLSSSQGVIGQDRARELYCCDSPSCSFAYCPACILRHYGQQRLELIHNLEEEEPWLCFKCDQQVDLSGSPASIRSVEY